MPLDIASFNSKELSYSGSKNTTGEFATLIQWLSDGRIDGKSMISHRFNFDKAAEAFEFAATHRDEVIKTVVFN